MLLRFSASNFASLRDSQELTMIASKLRGETQGLIETPELRGEAILPSAVIYGANASGKSNLIKALGRMRNFVLNSHRQGEPGEPLPLKRFALDPNYQDAPSVFSIDFICNSALYSYSFDATSAGFSRESLHVTREGRASLLFERSSQGFSFGRSLKGRNKVIEDLTRPNSLYLSAAAQNNHEELGAVANFFRELRVDSANPVPARIVSTRLAEAGLPEKAVVLLKEIDIGVSDFKIDELPVEQRVNRYVLRRSVPQGDLFPAGAPDGRFVERDRDLRFRLGHPAIDGKAIYFDLADESAGTLQLLAILGPLFLALEKGSVVVIDEFGGRMHTRASEIILSLFNDKATNPKGAQLIVTTHDTNLLNATGLRRDQVWFTEKDHGGATHLYPLTDFETRKGDNLEKGYLQGRFGAIPFAGSFSTHLKAD